MLEGLGLDDTCNKAATPGLTPLKEQLVKDEGLPASGQTEFTGLAARANYLSADCIDLQFFAEEICRFMIAPIETSVTAIKGWVGICMTISAWFTLICGRRRTGSKCTATLIGLVVRERGDQPAAVVL